MTILLGRKRTGFCFKIISRTVLSIYRRRCIDVLILFLFSIIPFREIGWSGLLLYFDAGFPIRPVDAFLQHLYLWHSLVLGQVPIAYQPMSPYYFILAVPSYLGVPIEIIERVFLVSIFASGGIATYYLASILIKSRVAALSSGLFYMFNPFMMCFLRDLKIPQLFLSSLLPIFLALYIKGCTVRGNRKYVIALALVSTMMLCGNPATMLVAILPVALYFFYALVTERENIRHILRFSFFSFSLALLLNLWWILPFMYFFVNTNYLAFGIESTDAYDILNYASSLLKPQYVIRLWSYLFDIVTPNFLSFRDSILNILSGFILVILAYGALLLKRNKHVIFFSLLALLSTILALGNKPPFDDLYMWLWNNFIPFRVMRQPYHFVNAIALSYAILIGFTVSSLFVNSKVIKSDADDFKHRVRYYLDPRYILVLAIFVLIILNSLPMFSGIYSLSIQDVTYTTPFDRRYYDSLQPVNIPSYYYDLRNYLIAQDESFRVFILPKENAFLKYIWSPYEFEEILKNLSPKPIIISSDVSGYPMPYSTSVVDQIYSSIHQGKTNIATLLGLLNVKYVLLRTDTEAFKGTNYTELRRIAYPAEFVKPILESQRNITFDRSFGSIYLYKNEMTSPKIFAAENLIYTSDEFDSLITLSDSKLLSTKFAVLSMPKVWNTPNSYELPIFNSGTYKVYSSLPYQKGLQIRLDNDDTLFSADDMTRKLLTNMSDVSSWYRYENGGSYGNINAAEKVAFFTANPDWYIYRKDISYSIQDYPYTTFRFKTKGEFHLWIDWYDVEGKPHRTAIDPISSDYWTTKIIEVYRTLQLQESSIPDRVFGLELHIEKNSELWISDITISSQANLPFYSEISLSQATHNISLGSDLMDVYLIGELSSPITTFNEINPTQYKVRVKTEKPFLLVFSESYSPDWKVYINPINSNVQWYNLLSDQSKYNAKHFMVNGYANAWYIDYVGEYEITIFFWPQILYNLGCLASEVTFFACVTYIIYRLRRRHILETKKSLRKGIISSDIMFFPNEGEENG